jgi:3-deoxy-D-manno-octulosonate 8-phosphate phosphatase (KDO 8-P phosphatase)
MTDVKDTLPAVPMSSGYVSSDLVPPDWLCPSLHGPLKRWHGQLAGVRLLMLDVDGVLTDGSLWLDGQEQPDLSGYANEFKRFNVKDGQGLTLLGKVGISTGVLTARQSAVVNRRAKELNMAHVLQHARPKWPVLQQLLQQLNLPPQAVAYMGDDWPDVEVLAHVGFATCPADAVPIVQRHCQWISPLKGGHGAVRQLCDLLLAANNWQPALSNVPLTPG